MPRHVVVAITGASGSIYGLRLVRELLKAGVRVTLLASDSGTIVLQEECGLDWRGDESVVRQRMLEYFGATESDLAHYAAGNLLAPIASGSSAPDAMIICPASTVSYTHLDVYKRQALCGVALLPLRGACCGCDDLAGFEQPWIMNGLKNSHLAAVLASRSCRPIMIRNN